MLKEIVRWSILALGVSAISGCSGLRKDIGVVVKYPEVYNQQTLAKMDTLLSHSGLYGNGLKPIGVWLEDDTRRLSEGRNPLFREKFYDDRNNSVYIEYEIDRETGEDLYDKLRILVTRDRNRNNAVDLDELGFEMLNLNSELDSVERVGLNWVSVGKNGYDYSTHGINRGGYDSGNHVRFGKADEFFGKIMDQRNSILGRKENYEELKDFMKSKRLPPEKIESGATNMI